MYSRIALQFIDPRYVDKKFFFWFLILYNVRKLYTLIVARYVRLIFDVHLYARASKDIESLRNRIFEFIYKKIELAPLNIYVDFND